MLKKLLFILISLGMGTQVSAQVRLSPRQALSYYAERGNVSGLRGLAQRGYSMDLTDAQGNTALCEMVLRQNKTAVNALLQVGANTSAACMSRIPSSSKTAMGISSNPVPTFESNTMPAAETNAGDNFIGMTSSPAESGEAYGGLTYSGAAEESGLSTAAWVGIGVGAAALVGGGIALAAGGGGGGGGSKNSIASHGTQNADGSWTCIAGYTGGDCTVCADGYGTYGTNECHAKLTCLNGGTQVGSKCECKEGWTGTTCQTADASCTGQSSHIAKCVSESQCQYGDKTLYKCDECGTGYKGSTCSDCTDGYDHYEKTTCHKTLGCKGGKQVGDSCVCNQGITGDLCDKCADGYDLFGTTTCHKILNCGSHGSQSGADCVCDTNLGYTGKYCTDCMSGYGHYGRKEE